MPEYTVEKTKESWFNKIENMHPYQTLMYLGMFGSGLIFLFLTVAFLSSGIQNLGRTGTAVPAAFIASSVVILFSGYLVSQLLVHYKKEEIELLKNKLFYTFMLGLIFTLMQFLGWKELTAMGIDFRGLPSGSFLYVLTGIHIFHLIGAMVFALLLYAEYHKKNKDQITQLILVTNPFERMRIRLFVVYWYFMDLIWLILFSIIAFAF
jgi:cytochrome c oxidase subunit III